MAIIQPKRQTEPIINSKWNEQILVIKRSTLFKNEIWQGIKSKDFQVYLDLIKQNKEFIARGPAETNFDYKQIIPYLIFNYQDKYFLMQRAVKASEQRLANKYTLGIGGHLRQEDLNNDDIFSWAEREFNEEIQYQGSLTIKPIGILNDDSNDVGKVHLGIILLIEGDSDKIKIKSELTNGQLISLDQCKNFYSSMETWSQLVFNQLVKK